MSFQLQLSNKLNWKATFISPGGLLVVRRAQLLRGRPLQGEAGEPRAEPGRRALPVQLQAGRGLRVVGVQGGGGGGGGTQGPQGPQGHLRFVRALRPLAANCRGGEEVRQLRQRGEGVSERYKIYKCDR